jgi:hypothetical protein
MLTFFEHVAEVRNSPKFFRIEITSSWQWECIAAPSFKRFSSHGLSVPEGFKLDIHIIIELKLHGYRSIDCKLIRRNIDNCTVN